MATFVFVGLLIGGVNLILLGVVIFILKQPDPTQNRQQQDLNELQEKISDLAKHFVSFEKKVESLINESKNESLAKLDRVKSDVGRQLQEINDNL